MTYHDGTPEETDEVRSLYDDMIDLSLDLHADGRRETAARSNVKGTAYRHAANRIRAVLGIALLDYDGRPMIDAVETAEASWVPEGDPWKTD